MAHVHIDFDDNNKAEFDIQTENSDQLLTVLVGLEAYVASLYKIPVSELRLALDEIKQELEVKDKVG